MPRHVSSSGCPAGGEMFLLTTPLIEPPSVTSGSLCIHGGFLRVHFPCRRLPGDVTPGLTAFMDLPRHQPQYAVVGKCVVYSGSNAQGPCQCQCPGVEVIEKPASKRKDRQLYSEPKNSGHRNRWGARSTRIVGDRENAPHCHRDQRNASSADEPRPALTLSPTPPTHGK